MKAKNILIVLLMFISLTVLILHLMKVNAWIVICLYWLVLSIKNLVDFIEEG